MNSKPTIIFDPYPRNEEMVFTADVEKELNQISKLVPHFGSRAPDDLVEDNLVGTEGFGDIKYFVGGGYAKVSSNKKNNPLQTSFQEIFSKDKLNKIPTQDEIKIIWAFMNYFLNFDPLKNIKSEEKVKQNMSFMI